MPEYLTSTMFAENLNTRFRLYYAPGQWLEVELTEVQEGPSSSRHEQFSILFRGPNETPLPQRTYRLEHERIGAFDLFLVPVGRDSSGMYYQAVFSRLNQSEP